MSDYEDSQNPLEKIVRIIEAKNKVMHKMHAENKKQSEENEKKIMMQLWADIDNNTESYYQAFQTVMAYSIMIKTFRKKVMLIPPNMRPIIAKALSEQMQDDAQLDLKIEEMRLEFEKEMEKND
jgi:hypothetical protein